MENMILIHHGIKGMKWGVRRSKEELLYDSGSINSIINKRLLNTKTIDGISVLKISDHVGHRANERKIKAKDIADALHKPIHIDKLVLDAKGYPSRVYVGHDATVCVNPFTGLMTTVWKTGDKKRKKYEAK